MSAETASSPTADELIGYWPRLSRFYGLPYSEIATMPYAAIRVYVDRIESLQAEEQILAIQAASFAHYSEEDQERTNRYWERVLDGGLDQEPSQFPSEHTLGAMGIAVVMEDDDA